MLEDPNNVGQTTEDDDEGLDYTGTAGMDIVDGTEHDDTISTLGGTDIVAGGRAMTASPAARASSTS